MDQSQMNLRGFTPVLHRVQKLWIGPGKARKLLGIQLVTLALALE